MNSIIEKIEPNWAEMPQMHVTYKGEERLEFVYELLDHCETVAEDAEQEVVDALFEHGSIVINGQTLTTVDIVRQFLRDSNYRDQYILEQKKFHPRIQSAYEQEMADLEYWGCNIDRD